MTAKPDKLPVIFRACREDVMFADGITFAGDATAIFPTLPGGPRGRYMTCYSHNGQHSYCGEGWYYQSTRPAKPDEYADLLAELRSIYENDDCGDAVELVVYQRITPMHRRMMASAVADISTIEGVS